MQNPNPSVTIQYASIHQLLRLTQKRTDISHLRLKPTRESLTKSRQYTKLNISMINQNTYTKNSMEFTQRITQPISLLMLLIHLVLGYITKSSSRKSIQNHFTTNPLNSKTMKNLITWFKEDPKDAILSTYSLFHHLLQYIAYSGQELSFRAMLKS